jgi:hypothetical protein
VLVAAADVDWKEEKGLKPGFMRASPKQIAATTTMPAMAMTMSFLKLAPIG